MKMKLTDYIVNERRLRPFAALSARVATVALLLFIGAPAKADDWPRLGGLGGTGVSLETGLKRAWPDNGPKVLWSCPVSEGFAGPAARDGQVYLLDRENNEQDVLRCFELTAGKELWRLAYDAAGSLPYNGSRNVPTVDEQYVFIVGPFGHFHCVDRATHTVVWSKHLVNDFKDPQIDTAAPAKNREEKLVRAQVPMWGMTQAPLLYRDTVIVAPQTQKTGLVAYEKSTGKMKWQTGYIGRNWYSHVSPYLTTLCGVDQVIMLAQPSDPEKSPANAPPALVSSIDASTGRILWTNSTPGPYKLPIPQPLRIAEDRLLITGGYGLGCVGLQVGCAKDTWSSKVVFHNKNAATHIHAPILYKERIYMTSFKEHGGVANGLACLDIQCNLIGQTGSQFDFGSYLIADGMVFIMHGRTGELHLFELAPDGFKLLAKAKVLDGKNNMVWAPMALSDGKLLVRDQHELKCLELH
jgi:outer membrane protein assembly factor BamB